VLYGIYNLYGFFFDGSGISYAGHFGGLILGLAAGFRIRGFKRSMKILLLSIASLVLILLVLSLL
jgi:membrane associated rhomboid family serine protease